MSPRAAFIYCTCALLCFSLLAYAAASTESATVDEPPHVTAAYACLRHGDFRIELEHPPLWKYWAALPWLLGPPVNDHFDEPAVREALRSYGAHWSWSVITLYRTPGNDADRLLAASRLMMLAWGAALGAMISLFAYRVAGPLAACVAVTVFALDPNFLAHAPLVKNDVAITLLITAVTYVTWRLGQSLTLPRVLALSLLCAAAVTTKLTGLLAGPLVATLLLTRALLPAPWPLSSFRIHHSEFSSRSQRLLAAAAVCLSCALLTYASIWAVYLFRFNPSPDPTLHINPADMLSATPAPALLSTLTHFSLAHHLLPEAFLDGLLFTSTHANRVTYLLGQVTPTGAWYYFPLAFLVKTPLTTLLLLLISFAASFASPSRPSRSLQSSSSLILHPSSFRPLWLPLCLTLPVLLFGLSAIASRLNIGLRHIFPLYPFLYLFIAITLARLYARHPKLLRRALPLFFLTLAAESLSAYPHFIPFFNRAAGGPTGGYRLLSDSNLDWGQDLPLVADWQQRHPDRTLYLAYFGSADPAHYGIQYHNLPHGFALGPPPEPLPAAHATVAVSAMILQRVWPGNAGPDYYAPLRSRKPTEILGGSIYLYDLNPD